MGYTRHTMGQDWGGRNATNPKDATRVTKQQVLTYAASVGIRVKRDPGNYSMWWRFCPEKNTWLTITMTNYTTLRFLQRLNDEKQNAVADETR